MMSLVPNVFYWARSEKHNKGRMTVVLVSTIFGEESHYWSLAIPGSDQHHMISDFEIISRIEEPDNHPIRQAAE